VPILELPYCPRKAFEPFHDRPQRWAVLVCHRRAGKTTATLNDLIWRALQEKKQEGRYVFIFPQRNQAKDTAWAMLKRYAAPMMDGEPNGSELRIQLFNGAMVRLHGADNPDALRGPYLDGVVLDEFADMRAGAWSEVVRPMEPSRRDAMARSAAPYVHPQLAAVKHGGDGTSIKNEYTMITWRKKPESEAQVNGDDQRIDPGGAGGTEPDGR